LIYLLIHSYASFDIFPYILLLFVCAIFHVYPAKCICLCLTLYLACQIDQCGIYGILQAAICIIILQESETIIHKWLHINKRKLKCENEGLYML